MQKNATKAKDYRLVFVLLAFVHAILFIRDIFVQDSFLRGDRAHDRLRAIQDIIAASNGFPSLIQKAATLGIVGDYGVHAVFYAVGGRLAVIAFQVALALSAAVIVAYMGQVLTSSRRFAIAVGLAYGLLPQSVAFPHILVSEGVSNPLLIMGTGAAVYALRSGKQRLWWVVSGLLYGVATLVRPGLLLIPLIALALLMIAERRMRGWPVLGLGVAGIAPFFLWCSFIYTQTGEFGPGNSTQDLRLNYSMSVARVLQSEGLAPADGTLPPELPLRINSAKYLEYLRAHPVGFAEMYARSFVILVFDSGVGRFYVNLLGYGAEQRDRLQGPGTGWRAELARSGVLRMLWGFWQMAPGILLTGVVGGIVFAAVDIGLAVGYFVSVRKSSPLWSSSYPAIRKWLLAFLLAVPIYVVGTSLVVPYASSRHRSQGDFAWVIVSALGWCAISVRRSSEGRLSYPILDDKSGIHSKVTSA